MAVKENSITESVNGDLDHKSSAALEARIEKLEDELRLERKASKRLARRDKREEQLKPYQVELLKLQRHLEPTTRR